MGGWFLDLFPCSFFFLFRGGALGCVSKAGKSLRDGRFMGMDG